MGKTTSTNAGEKICWECGMSKHQKKNCFAFKNKQKKANGGQASTSKDPPPNQGDHAILIKNSSLNFSSMNTNFNVTQEDTLSWWIDSGASRHVCNSTK